MRTANPLFGGTQSPAILNFSHPAIGKISTEYGFNNINWDYTLNVQRYPTYAGEVVQILSVAINDITITGQIATYEQMELMFAYFAAYMEVATQGPGVYTELDQLEGNPAVVGNGGAGQGGSTDTKFNEIPIHITYPYREWDFYIQPKEMIGFTYGMGVVAPEWSITAAVYDANPNLESQLKQAIATSFVNVTDQNQTASQKDTLTPTDIFNVNGEIGFNPNNPFSSPFPEQGPEGTFDPGQTDPLFSGLGKYYQDLTQKYASNDYSDLTNQFGSGPLPPTTPDTNKVTEKRKQING